MAKDKISNGIIVTVVGGVLTAIILAALGLSGASGGEEPARNSGVDPGQGFESDPGSGFDPNVEPEPELSNICYTPYGWCETYNYALLGTACSCSDEYDFPVPGQIG